MSGDHPERGDTLIEVLIALAIVAIAATALIGGILTSITASSEHRSLSVNTADLKSYADAARGQIERQSSPKYTSCAAPADYAVSVPMPASYTVSISKVEYWNGTAFVPSCSAGSTAPQLITLVATSPTQVTSGLSFAVRKPS